MKTLCLAPLVGIASVLAGLLISLAFIGISLFIVLILAPIEFTKILAASFAKKAAQQ
ncbi:hypothetical protein FAES_3755 [Fibrella aestuarina BUZ 2]|uniref:Uncharacterized protein n=1 Tax=Fibrella aestuarina BUZ 2 TaxID=1166018 RepID=I0KCA9_9BACT|nr:hypothetical protein [Fibrella aestuarina]CCH01762.1 hypothetical protein FAES_3755 [Fibrella aestuarina BUZ 2]